MTVAYAKFSNCGGEKVYNISETFSKIVMYLVIFSRVTLKTKSIFFKNGFFF